MASITNWPVTSPGFIDHGITWPHTTITLPPPITRVPQPIVEHVDNNYQKFGPWHLHTNTEGGPYLIGYKIVDLNSNDAGIKYVQNAWVPGPAKLTADINALCDTGYYPMRVAKVAFKLEHVKNDRTISDMFVVGVSHPIFDWPPAEVVYPEIYEGTIPTLEKKDDLIDEARVLLQSVMAPDEPYYMISDKFVASLEHPIEFILAMTEAGFGYNANERIWLKAAL